MCVVCVYQSVYIYLCVLYNVYAYLNVYVYIVCVVYVYCIIVYLCVFYMYSIYTCNRVCFIYMCVCCICISVCIYILYECCIMYMYICVYIQEPVGHIVYRNGSAAAADIARDSSRQQIRAVSGILPSYWHPPLPLPHLLLPPPPTPATVKNIPGIYILQQYLTRVLNPKSLN